MTAWFGNLGLRWKVLLAPALFIAVIIALVAFALQTQRANRSTVDALMLGPVRQAEVAADFSIAVWTAHTRLYRLTATATNEVDQEKIKAVAAQTSTSLAEVSEKLKAMESITTGEGKTTEVVDKLKTSVAGYLKQAHNVIKMANGEGGAALMFLISAERSFAEIEKLTDEMTEIRKNVRDLEIARFNAKLDEQGMLLTGIGLVAVLLGCLISFFVGRGIANPVVRIAEVIKRISDGDFDVTIPATGRRDEIGVIADAVVSLKASS